jgi:hypothetical protein
MRQPPAVLHELIDVSEIHGWQVARQNLLRAT